MSNWPTQQIGTGNVDNDLDVPTREDFLAAIVALNALIEFGECASKSADNVLTGQQRLVRQTNVDGPARIGGQQRITDASRTSIPRNASAAFYYLLSNGVNVSGSGLFDASNSLVVAPSAGIYYVSAAIMVRASASGSYGGLVRAVLDVTSHDRSSDEFGCIDLCRLILPSSSTYMTMKLSGEVYLTAGQQVGLYVANMSGADSVDAFCAYFSARGPY